MRYKKILDEVVGSISPSKSERDAALSKVNSFLLQLNGELKRMNVKAVAVLGGSYAKDTWLSGDYDVDVFVKFDPVHKDQNLSDLLERALRKWDHERIHGSRDYFWVRDSVKYEIVPVLSISKPTVAQNVTDFSPLHVAWVNKKGSKLKNDIRLVKKFCKAAKCYGAESYIRGFSGHVVDILTIYYGGFIPFLKASLSWKPKVIVDYDNVFKGKALLVLNKSKIEGPMVVIDPIDKNRNASAALTLENLERFVSAAKVFLKKPSVDAFDEREVDFAKLAKKGVLVKVNVSTLDDKEDVAGTKFVRAFEHVRDSLCEFKVKDSGWVWDKKSSGLWYFVLGASELSNIIDWQGPPLKLGDAVHEFKRHYKNTFVKRGRIFAKVERSEVSYIDVLKRVLSDGFIISRVKFAKFVPN